MIRAARRDLALVTVGVAISTAGDQAALIAMLLRLRPHGSAWVAALLAGELVPVVLLAPLVGLLVDRFETRRVLLIALLGQGVVALPLAFAHVPWAVVGLFTALNALGALVRPATAALVPVICRDADATRGYSLIGIGTGIGLIIGPAAGGLITAAAGAGTALFADAATFVVLAACTAALRARRPSTHRTAGAPRPKAWSGFGLLTADPVLRVALAVSAVAVACAVVDNVAAPFRFVDQLHAGAGGYGLYLTFWGVGALAGSQLVPLLGAGRTEHALAIGNAMSGLGIAGIGLLPTVPLAFAAAVFGGIGNGMTNVAQSALVSQRTPAAQAGRAFAATAAVLQLAVGLGTVAGSPLVALLRANGALTVAGAVSVLPAAVALVIAVRRRPAPARTDAALVESTT